MTSPVASHPLRRILRCLQAVVLIAALPAAALGQSWSATQYFRFNIENVLTTPAAAPGAWTVKVVFSVTNPVTGTAWDIKADAPFAAPPAVPSAALTLDIGWDPSSDFTNTGSANPTLSPLVSPVLGGTPALAVQVRNLQVDAHPCTTDAECPGAVSLDKRFWIAKDVTPVAFTRPVLAGRVGIEGRLLCVPPVPVCPPASSTSEIVPVQSAVADFAFTASSPLTAMVSDARRPIVDIAKCKGCHDGEFHGNTVVPRLSLHGGNRNENLGLCVMCHNPNQTDVPYRYLNPASTAVSGPEVPVDFKTMVHSIHAGGFRKTPFVVIGRNSSVNDFSGVRFPAELRNCLNCHVESGGKGSFELPLQPSVLGTTISTGSTYLVPLNSPRSINVNPATHLKITPTAAVCSSCHDEREVRSHMTRTGGASFATSQASIGTTVRERCASCHGPGKEKDVRRVHEVGSGGDGHGEDAPSGSDAPSSDDSSSKITSPEEDRGVSHSSGRSGRHR